jgi:hypothetical protein
MSERVRRTEGLNTRTGDARAHERVVAGREGGGDALKNVEGNLDVNEGHARTR